MVKLIDDAKASASPGKKKLFAKNADAYLQLQNSQKWGLDGSVDLVNCIRPNSQIYCLRRGTFLTGVDHLRLQGIFACDFPGVLCPKFCETQKRTMAGDSFNAGQFIANALASIACGYLAPPIPPRVPASLVFPVENQNAFHGYTMQEEPCRKYLRRGWRLSEYVAQPFPCRFAHPRPSEHTHVSDAIFRSEEMASIETPSQFIRRNVPGWNDCSGPHRGPRWVAPEHPGWLPRGPYANRMHVASESPGWAPREPR